MPRTLSRLVERLKPHTGAIALATLASAVAAGAAAVWARLLGPLLEGVLLSTSASIGPWKLGRDELTLQLPLLIAGVAVLKAAAQWLHGGLMNTVGQRVLAGLRRDLYGKLLALPPSWHEQRHSGDLLSRFTADVAALELSVGTAVSSYLKDSLTVLALLGVCASIDWRLSLLAFGVVPAMAWPVSRFAKSVKKSAAQTQGSLAALTTLTSEQLHNLPVVQAYRAEARALDAFDAEQRRYLEAMKRSLFVRAAFTPTLEMLGISGIALCLWAGARAVALEPQLGGRLLSFLAAALLMYQPLKGLAGTFSDVARGLSAGDRLFEVLDADVRPDTGRPAPPLTRSLALDGVTLVYPDGRTALDGLTLEIAAGKTTALIGPSGAGKSSLVSLLLGLTHATKGRITWDGEPLESFSISSLRARIAWVSQEPLLLSGTVRENLELGRAGASDEQLWRALEQANAREFVAACPKGLDEEVGERGARFSGGQRQRLAIARALLVEPSLLLLDEPTSSLDEQAQAEVQKALTSVMARRTVVVIAHRLGTIANADVVHELPGR